MDSLPQEILLVIFSFMKSHYSIACTCKYIHSIFKKNIHPSDAQVISIFARMKPLCAVEKVIEDKHSNLAAGNNAPLIATASHGNISLLKRLLSDPRVKITNTALKVAAAKGHYDIVLLLLKHGCFTNEAVKEAASNGHNHVLQLLIDDGRFDTTCAIIHASENGHHKTVRLLMSYPHINPAIFNNLALTYAAANGHHKVVQALLEDPRVNPSDRNNFALYFAIKNKRKKVIKLLRKHISWSVFLKHKLFTK